MRSLTITGTDLEIRRLWYFLFMYIEIADGLLCFIGASKPALLLAKTWTKYYSILVASYLCVNGVHIVLSYFWTVCLHNIQEFAYIMQNPERVTGLFVSSYCSWAQLVICFIVTSGLLDVERLILFQREQNDLIGGMAQNIVHCERTVSVSGWDVFKLF